MKDNSFELWAFYANHYLLEKVESELLTGFIIDLEKKGKHLRQKLYDTQINEHSIYDLKKVRNTTKKKLICRINPQNSLNEKEIKEVLDIGVDEILLPMIKSLNEVENVLNLVKNETKVGVMLETNESFAIIEQLDKLPLSRYYVGLNDLAIQNNYKNIFKPMIDGTIEEIRPKISKNFGIAGLTHPKLGNPIPSEMLIRIMLSLNCSFGILRRSFYRDLNHFSADEIFKELKKSTSHKNNKINNYTLQKDKTFFSKLSF